jgi:hypothetical protein
LLLSKDIWATHAGMATPRSLHQSVRRMPAMPLKSRGQRFDWHPPSRPERARLPRMDEPAPRGRSRRTGQ